MSKLIASFGDISKEGITILAPISINTIQSNDEYVGLCFSGN